MRSEDEGKVVGRGLAPKHLAGNTLLKREMISDSPIERNIEKLEGFIADHHAEMTLTERNRVQLRIDGDKGGPTLPSRRRSQYSSHHGHFAP